MEHRPLLQDDQIPEAYREFKPHPYRQEPQDLRDVPARAQTATAVLPRRVILPRIFPVRNQGARGSCVGHAVALLQQYYEWKRDGSAIELSPRFAYFVGRGEDRAIPWDVGTFNRSALKGAQHVGIAPELWCPYNGYDESYRETPDRWARLQAKFHRTPLYVACYTLDDLRASIAMGYAVAFVFPMYESFFRNVYLGDIPFPQDPHEGYRGFHSVTAAGFDDDARYVDFINSHGEQFGNRGWGRMSYDYWDRPGEVTDMWSLRPPLAAS